MNHSATPARPNKAPPPAMLLAAACRIVNTDGLAGLALRPLAQALDVSVTVLTQHYGIRADVLAAICAAAAERDAAAHAGWRALLAQLPAPLAPALAADLIEAVLEDQATRHRDLSVLFLEMLHASTWDDALRLAMAPWFAVRRDFWRDVGGQALVAPELIACGWWHGYVIAEQAYGVVLDGVGPYRLLRRVCLQRIVAGGAAAAVPAADATLFALLARQMQQAAAAPATPAPRRPDWYGAAARACGIRLAAQGVGALTHRAIAADIGIAHSTLSYRYPAQHDLVLAGLDSIIAHIVTAVDADDLDQLQRLRTANDGSQLDLARASLAVAIAATRMPDLAGCVADLRSRRGGNLVKVFSKYLPHAPGIDALAAHVVSMGLTGLTITEPLGAASEQSVANAFAAAGRWLSGYSG